MNLRPADVRRAGRQIRRGGLVVFPTETVYGLGADATNPRAVLSIFAAKGRPADNPLIVHIQSANDLPRVAADPSVLETSLLAAFSPGPFTLVVRARDDLPRIVTAGLETVAVRIPDHPVAMGLLGAARVPVAAPSANRSGEPSPTTVAMARESLGQEGIIYLDGGQTRVGLESTVARLSGSEVTILRPGAVTAEMIRSVFPVLTVRHADQATPDTVRSPGTRHRHYTPRAAVVTIDPQQQLPLPDDTTVAVVGVADDVEAVLAKVQPREALVVRTARDAEQYASSLYRWFSELDDEGVGCIVAVLPPAGGIGTAIRDRLARASGAHPTEGA